MAYYTLWRRKCLWKPLKTLFTMTPLGEVLELEPRPETGRELLQEVGMDTTDFRVRWERARALQHDRTGSRAEAMQLMRRH